MANLKLNNVVALNESSGAITIADAVVFPADHAIQILSANKTTAQTIAATSGNEWANVSDLTKAITPQTNSKVLVLLTLNVSGIADYQQHARIVRTPAGGSATPVGVGAVHGSKLGSTFSWRMSATARMLNCSAQYLDESPGGNGSLAITYKVQVEGEGTANIFINQTATEGADNATWSRTSSSITLIEISA